MSLFGSTSPSYLIMASLDLCNRYISEQIADDINTTMSAIGDLRKRISGKYTVYNGEPYHLTLLCNGNDPVSYTHLDVYKRQVWMLPDSTFLTEATSTIRIALKR